ncbi:MAG TPA: YfiR family protein [Kiritimatiellia bacterium]|nr:YfiR family protein [Kiritimatiellia bacterium]HMP33534.1 YfiR family protein [Kiritimatiellia bacterium]
MDIRRVIRACIPLALALGQLLAAEVHANRADEYRLKTAYLCRFAEFVTWPATAPTGTITIGIVSYEPYRAAIDTEFAAVAPEHRPCQVIPITSPEEARRCHIVFINSPDRAVLANYLKELAGVPVLVVTDLKAGARLGAAINFFTVDGKIRFAINQEAAEQAGLSISSRLLRLGRVVKGGMNDEEPP